MYYGETVLNSIGEEAFWRENDSGDTLYIGYIIGYPKSSVPFYNYDWAAPIGATDTSTICTAYIRTRRTPAPIGIMKAPGISVHLHWLDYRQLPVVWEVFVPGHIRRSRTFLAWSCQL